MPLGAMTTPSQSKIETLLAETAWVRALAARLTGSAEEADDLVQETWVAALRRPPTSDGPVRPWLATVVRNTLRQRYRKGAARRSREEDRAPEEGSVPAPEEWLERLESQELVSRLVRDLPADQREVVLLRYHEGLNSREISTRLGVPAGTVRWRLKAALDDLRARLDREHDGDRAAWVAALAPLVRTDARQAAVAVGAGSLVGAWGVFFQVAAAIVLVGGATWWLVDLRSQPASTPELPALVATAEDSRDATPSPASDGGSPATAEDRIRVASAVPSSSADPFADLPWTHVRLRVVDATGAPVAGARVEAKPGIDAIRLVDDLLQSVSPLRAAREMVGHTAETSGAGIAELRTRLLLGTSDVELVVVGPNEGRWSDTILLDAGADLDLGEVVLQPGGLVIARVFGADGEPAEARVVVGPAELGEDGAATRARGAAETFVSAFVDETGEVFVEREGTFRLWAQARPYQPWTWSEPFELVHGQRITLDVRLDSTGAHEPVVIRVLDPAGELRPATVQVRSDRGVEGSWRSLGEAKLGSSFQPGDPLTVTVHDGAQEYASQTVRFEEPSGVLVVRLEPAPNVTRTLRVRSGGSAELEGLSVRIHARGTYHEREPSDDVYELVLPDGPDETFDLQIRADEHVILEREGLVARDLPEDWLEVLAPLPGVTGRVTVNGEPVAGAQIRASHRCDPGEWQRRGGGLYGVRWSSGWDAQTEADGRFRLPLQWAGDWVLRVRAKGYADALVDLSPYDPALGARDLEFELVEPGRVEGLVLDAAGAPVARHPVALTHPLHQPRTTQTDRDGRYVLDDVPPGEWRASAPLRVTRGSGYDILGLPESWLPRPNVTVRAGVPTRHDLHHAPLHERAGRVDLGPFAAEEASLAEGWKLHVSADGPDPFEEIAETTALLAGDGAFEVRLPGAGPWILSLAGPGLAGRVTWKLDALPPADGWVLALPLARLSGRIGGCEDAAQLKLRLDGGEAFEFSAAVTLAADGAFGPVLVPAGTHEVKLPVGVPLPVPPIEMATDSVSDLVEEALVNAIVALAMNDAAATKLSLTLAPGAEQFVELP